jgi:phage-related protein
MALACVETARGWARRRVVRGSNQARNVQYRVLFCIEDSTMVLLHGFVKKVRTARGEIAIGRDRKKDVEKE